MGVKGVNKTHGDSRTETHKVRTYTSWIATKERCFNKNHSGYKRYGGIGTKVCDGYKNDYLLFKNDIGGCPHGRYSVDRINSNGHYSCGKCDECIKNGWEFNIRWATDIVQANNRKSNRYVIVKGVSMTYAQAEKMLGFLAGTISHRIKIHKWSIEKTLNTPIRKRRKAKTSCI